MKEKTDKPGEGGGLFYRVHSRSIFLALFKWVSPLPQPLGEDSLFPSPSLDGRGQGRVT